MPYADPKVVCSPWITTAELCCAGGSTVTDCGGVPTPLDFKWSDDQLIEMASNLLFARTCFRYPGVCVRQVWPCVDCGRCGNHPCGCGTYDAIELAADFPILSVTDVSINGVTVDPALYRLDENDRIVRIDGDLWPSCNNLGIVAPYGTNDEIVVTYETGRTPPVELQLACAELVCELKKACNGDASCSLPAHVRSVSRRGVDMDVYDVSALLQQGITGNPLIDHALTVHGRCGGASVYDATRDRRRVRIT